MKVRRETMVLAVSCFLAGFALCYLLTPPQSRQRTVTPAAGPLARALAVTTLPSFPEQVIQIDSGVWYRHSDNVLRRAPSPEMQDKRYDLIDTRWSINQEEKL